MFPFSFYAVSKSGLGCVWIVNWAYNQPVISFLSCLMSVVSPSHANSALTLYTCCCDNYMWSVLNLILQNVSVILKQCDQIGVCCRAADVGWHVCLCSFLGLNEASSLLASPHPFNLMAAWLTVFIGCWDMTVPTQTHTMRLADCLI